MFALLLMLNPRLRGSVARGTGRGVDSSLLDPVSRKRKGETASPPRLEGVGKRNSESSLLGETGHGTRERERKRGSGEEAVFKKFSPARLRILLSLSLPSG